MHSERRNMYACICGRERRGTRVKTRGQYDVAKARHGCRRVPTRRERKTGTNGLSIKENAIDGEGKGDRARILGVSHRCPVYRERKRDKGNQRRKRRKRREQTVYSQENFVVCREAAAGKEFRTRTGSERKMQRKNRAQAAATAATAGTRGRGGGKRR